MPKEAFLLDSDPLSRRICQRLLENAGMMVTTLTQIQEIETLAQKNAPHLILLSGSGRDQEWTVFLHRRRVNPVLKSVPVMVLSSSSDRAIVQQTLIFGASDFIVKPIVASVFLRRVKKLVRDIQFYTYEVSEAERESGQSMLQCTLSAEVKMTGQSGFTLSSGARLTPGREVEVRSESIEDWIEQESVFLVQACSGNPIQTGRYLSRINVLGGRNVHRQKNSTP